MAALVIAHSHVQLHYNMQGMVARPQAGQNVGRCRDGDVGMPLIIKLVINDYLLVIQTCPVLSQLLPSIASTALTSHPPFHIYLHHGLPILGLSFMLWHS